MLKIVQFVHHSDWVVCFVNLLGLPIWASDDIWDNKVPNYIETMFKWQSTKWDDSAYTRPDFLNMGGEWKCQLASTHPLGVVDFHRH